MEFHIFLCALFLCKVLFLIKQQHEFEGIILLEGMRKRQAQEAYLFGGCASKENLISIPPSSEQKQEHVDEQCIICFLFIQFYFYVYLIA